MSDAPITAKFQSDAPVIMRGLIRDLGAFNLSDEDAAAILGNFGTETGGFSLRLEEGKEKANQGYGWAQWTGYDPDASDRRLLFEEWCLDNGYSNVVANPADSSDEEYEEACYNYFVHEISETWEKRVLTEGGNVSGVYYPPLGDCSSLDEKTISFMKLFERPGTPHEDWRREMAHEALRLYREQYGAEEFEGVEIEGTEEKTDMPYNSICISSGHGLYVRGASGILDEVDEARRVTEQLASELISRGVEVQTFHDDISKSQSENLNRITDWHNSQRRDLDISIHFNAYEQVDKCMGTEVLYVTQGALASDLSEAIARCGFINRGAKKRTDLHFLNQTDMPSVLVEVCFVDSDCDAVLYEEQFENICYELANVLGGGLEEVEPLPPEEKPPPGPSIVQPGPIGDPSRPTVQPVPRIDIEIHGEVILTINGDLVKV